jgi:hypothetical protein
MEQDRKAFIQKLIQEGKSRHQVRTELISHGYGSAGFEEEYTATIASLGIEEPKHVSKDFTYTPKEKDELRKSEERYARKKGKSIRSLLMVIGVIVVCVVSIVAINTVMEVKPTGDDPAMDFSDTLMRTNIVSTSASVKVFGGRMGGYDGACEDVSVIAPIQCKADGTQFVVYGPITQGRMYCVDAGGYSGVVPTTPRGMTCISQ